MTVLVSGAPVEDIYSIGHQYRSQKVWLYKLLQLQEYDANVYGTIQTANDTPRILVHEV